jgi:hypothetical protein
VSALDFLLWSLLYALAATGLTLILRNAPVIRGWVQEMKKPWACNLCMPLYTSAAIIAPAAYYSRDGRYGLVYLATYLLSHLMLEKMARPPGPPPIPTSLLLDMDDDGITERNAATNG